MSKQLEVKYEPVDAKPVKSFFVSMLTRDIRLEEAILDLLDNCVDGILRSRKKTSARPYAGYHAHIEFRKDSFTISDNCGGIPWDLHEYAFRMGRVNARPDDAKGTVGVYGIGLKRAMFKMGQSCLISTQNGAQGYELEINPDWTVDEENWQIPVRAAKKSMKEDGTVVYVSDLHPGVAARFSGDRESFTSELRTMVATHYAFIIDKGFEVRINGTPVHPRPTRLVFSDAPGGKRGSIKPFIYRTKTVEGVEVFLTIGFTRPIPSEDEIADSQEETRYSTIDAGWTVVCNDRAVLYCDRTEMTGWGEAGVPRYHTQFIAISGIVEFKAEDASKLPTTTTKRGIDASSTLYLQIKNKMREGMRIFIDYTNRWKGRAEESKAHVEKQRTLSLHEIKKEAEKLHFASTKKTTNKGEQYRPDLPLPVQTEPRRTRVSFLKNTNDVMRAGEYLFNDEDASPAAVGERCFDLILQQAR